MIKNIQIFTWSVTEFFLKRKRKERGIVFFLPQPPPVFRICFHDRYELAPDHIAWTIECFHSRGQHLCKFIGIKESVYIREEFNSQRTDLGHQCNMAAVSLFWDTNMAAVTSCEKLSRPSALVYFFLGGGGGRGCPFPVKF